MYDYQLMAFNKNGPLIFFSFEGLQAVKFCFNKFSSSVFPMYKQLGSLLIYNRIYTSIFLRKISI